MYNSLTKYKVIFYSAENQDVDYRELFIFHTFHFRLRTKRTKPLKEERSRMTRRSFLHSTVYTVVHENEK